jgi:nicotinamidase-related amidase
MNPEETAVVVVDMQKFACDPEGQLYSEPSERVVGDIEGFVSELRAAGCQIVFTRDTHTEEQFAENDNRDEFAEWGVHAVAGTWGNEIAEGLDVHDDDEVVRKGTYDAFHDTDIESKLGDVQNVIIVGTLASICVLHTATGAHLNDYDVTVVEDLVGYLDEGKRAYALEHVDFLLGETVESRAAVQTVLGD